MDTMKQNFQKIQEQAQKDGVAVELLITGGENLKLGYQKKKLEKFESTQSQMAGFRVIKGAAQGYAYTENLSLESLLRTYRDALENANSLKNFSQDPVRLAQPSKVIDLSHLNVPQKASMDEKLKIAEKLEALVLEADPRIQSVPYCGFNESSGFKRVLNSEGVDHFFATTSYSGYAYGLASDGNVTKMDGESLFTRDFANIDVEKVAKKAAEKAVSRLGAKKLETGTYPAIIHHELMPAFLTMLVEHLSGQNVVEGKSLLNKRLGEKLGSEFFTLIDDPFDERGGGVRPFDSEGTPSQKTQLFENGVLKTFLTNLECSQKLQIPNTGHASRSPATSLSVSPSNLVIAPGESNLQEMLSRFPKVVLVTEMNGGLHAGYKEATGDFSLPCEGFLYEMGRLVGPVDQFVMSGNILHFIQDIIAVGSDYGEPSGNTMLSPDIMVKSLSFA